MSTHVTNGKLIYRTCCIPCIPRVTDCIVFYNYLEEGVHAAIYRLPDWVQELTTRSLIIMIWGCRDIISVHRQKTAKSKYRPSSCVLTTGLLNQYIHLYSPTLTLSVRGIFLSSLPRATSPHYLAHPLRGDLKLTVTGSWSRDRVVSPWLRSPEWRVHV